MPLPSAIITQLAHIEPEADFSGTLGGQVHSSNGKLFFVKLGSSSEAEQYAGEAESLIQINVAAPRLAPKVLSCGTIEDGRPFFISEYKNLGRLTDKSAVILAKRLATEMHAYKSQDARFGFSVPTYCGATRVKNGYYESWQECFSEMIADLLDKLGQYQQLCAKGESIRKKVFPKLLGPLKIEPVLLHGDLWSGNVGIDRATGQPVIFDPSSFFGHNEADLAIARIFGGFPAAFFTEYHNHRPKTEPVDQYELRMAAYELFHYLNHTVLFGGAYESSASKKMDFLLNANL
ncbi:hypothetical protein D9757_004633 [Collybiopsis confluens]|uniref:protein-ribulosamine 3-kinase n=1 Tax=Collybiopsis confluens TaxID=2823264 RepID=A0A8H5HSS8_9AGAR|nr:hypothetical protein D9757_004633 [Collybiopsis confluens]